MTFRIVEFIEAKKRGLEHAPEQLGDFIDSYMRGAVADYQVSAWLMAVCLRGMSQSEAVALTGAMVRSGESLDMSKINGLKFDKHSSGGVGDKVTIAFVPIVAAAGINIAKMSGRGLGHTGGTLDKLESIPGFRTALTLDEIVEQVSRIGACICAQTDSLAPADRALYALRDVTATVDCIPLIASSIMSKKLVCGADTILLDIKVGSGAFMKTRAEAQRLAQLCIQIGRAFGKRVEGFLTDMDQPLGRAVGNAVEIDEARALLAGEESEPRLLRETLRLCDAALEMAQIDARAEQIIESGAALRKFDEIVAAQTSPNACAKDEPEPCRIDLISPASGYVERLDALTVGRTAMRLGAGRSAKGEPIDHRGGIWLSKVQGEPVRRGDALATLSASAGRALAQETLDLLLSAYTIGEAPSAQGEDPILERIN